MSGGLDDPEVQARIARVVMISRIELVLLVLIVLDMVAEAGLSLSRGRARGRYTF